MMQKVDPQTTARADAFALWMSSPMPMVSMTKTFDVTHLLHWSRRKGMRFNLLLCWAIGYSASRMDEFFLLPGQGMLYRYDSLAVNVIVPNSKGGINSCDIPFHPDLAVFAGDYLRLTRQVATECRSLFVEDAMVVGTSAMRQTELDSIVNQYSDKFPNPMLLWGKYRRRLFRTLLPITFQFHHVQMDGMQGAQFLQNLQDTLNHLDMTQS